MFPCISCILLCSQKWLDVTLGTEPMLFLFFSHICIHPFEGYVMSLLAPKFWFGCHGPSIAINLLFPHLTFHQSHFSLSAPGMNVQVQIFTPSFTLALSSLPLTSGEHSSDVSCGPRRLSPTWTPQPEAVLCSLWCYLATRLLS